jgi:hypothetical protein
MLLLISLNSRNASVELIKKKRVEINIPPVAGVWSCQRSIFDRCVRVKLDAIDQAGNVLSQIGR